MRTMLALFVAVFSSTHQPVLGGELTWTKYTSSTPIKLEVNGNGLCTVYLSSQESQSAADLMIAVLDHDHPGKTQPLVGGGSINVYNLGSGDVSIGTNSLPACRMTLLGAEDEPEKVIDRFIGAAEA